MHRREEEWGGNEISRVSAWYAETRIQFVIYYLTHSEQSSWDPVHHHAVGATVVAAAWTRERYIPLQHIVCAPLAPWRNILEVVLVSNWLRSNVPRSWAVEPPKRVENVTWHFAYCMWHVAMCSEQGPLPESTESTEYLSLVYDAATNLAATARWWTRASSFVHCESDNLSQTEFGSLVECMRGEVRYSLSAAPFHFRCMHTKTWHTSHTHAPRHAEYNDCWAYQTFHIDIIWIFCTFFPRRSHSDVINFDCSMLPHSYTTAHPLTFSAGSNDTNSWRRCQNIYIHSDSGTRRRPKKTRRNFCVSLLTRNVGPCVSTYFVGRDFTAPLTTTERAKNEEI